MRVNHENGWCILNLGDTGLFPNPGWGMTQLMAMGLSLAVEVPIVLLIAWRWGWMTGQRRAVAIGLVATAATLLSHPLAWEAHAALSRSWSFAVSVLWVEIGVVLLEGIIFARVLRLGSRRGFALSATANIASFGVGLWITG
jgi:hypothetical protein